MDDFQPMLPELCNLIVTILQSKCVAPVIDIAKTVRQRSFHSIAVRLNLIWGSISCHFSVYFCTTGIQRVHKSCVNC